MLRQLGLQIKTASVCPPTDLEWMETEELEEYRQTYCLQRTSPVRVVLTHARLAASKPRRYASALRYALRLRRQGPVSRWRLLAYFAEAGLVAAWERRERIGHLHVHFGNPAATVALIAHRITGIPFSLTMHGPDIFDDVTLNLLPEKFRRAQFVRCISHFCKSQSLRLAPPSLWPKFHVIRCGVDLAQFRPRAEQEHEGLRILCVGRLVPSKGQHVLLDACRLLRERGVAFHLTLIGDGPDRQSLEAAAEGHLLNGCVAFRGPCGQAQVRAELANTDVMVLPSFAEGIPVVLMEAMACGVPCVSTPVMGIPELIAHGNNGLLAAPSNIVELADRIQRLASDPALRRTLGHEARATVTDGYDVRANCRRLRDLLASQVPE